jgi:NAD(P)H-hydrate epimerase
MTYVLTAEQMRAVDRAATERFGVPTLLLMENAGRGVAALVAREATAAGAARGRALRVRVVCGAGSNGGDGFVAARHLVLGNDGAGGGEGVAPDVDVRVLLAAPRAKIVEWGGDAAVALGALEAVARAPDGRRVVLEDAAPWGDGDGAAARWRERLGDADVVVDALFGTGLRADAPIRGVPALAIAAMNAAPGLKVAVDIPSGIEADSGRAAGAAFRADVTGTMGARKLGFSIDADVPAGRVEVVGLGAPIAPPAALGPFCHWIDERPTLARVPRRGPSGHKGTGGHLLVIAGAAGKTGAAMLSGLAALRGGAGLCTLASTAAGQAALDAKVLELMSTRYADGDDADAGSAGRIEALATRMQAVAIGPGIPTGPGMRALVEALVARLPLPMVVDADALNLLGADVARVVGAAPAPRLLTPHPGEMARLLGMSTADVQHRRVVAARALASRARAIVVLKGARTLVAVPDGTVHINPIACPALGTAGSGDVLTGLIGALLAQRLEAVTAATVGVLVHGLAGQQAAEAFGGDGGIVAGDLPEAIARVLARGRALTAR